MERNSRVSVPERTYTLWICAECDARAEWTGTRDFCGACGSRDRETVELVPRSGVVSVEDFDRATRRLGEAVLERDDARAEVERLRNERDDLQTSLDYYMRLAADPDA